MGDRLKVAGYVRQVFVLYRNDCKGICLDRLSIGCLWLLCVKLIQNNFICLMEKWVQIFKCIISHSSTKSLVPPLPKFTIWNLDLFFRLFRKLNSLINSAVYLLACQYFGMEKQPVPWESRIAFCRLFVVQVKKVCYERKVRGELLECFFHCTLVCPCPYVPTASFRLMTLWTW